MSNSVWAPPRLPTVRESPLPAADDIQQHRREQQGGADVMMQPQFSSPVVYQPFSLDAQGPRYIFHERRSSAPPQAAMRLAGPCRHHMVEAQKAIISGSETTDLGSEQEEEQSCTESRQFGAVGPGGARVPRERRRSSWAAGAVQALPPQSNPGAYHEALLPDQLYKQFIQIRDAVLRKGQAGGGQEHLDGTGGREGAVLHSEQGTESGGTVVPRAAGDVTCQRQSLCADSLSCGRAVLTPRDASDPEPSSAEESPPDSPYCRAVSIAAYATCAGGVAQSAQASEAAGASRFAQLGGRQSSGRMHQLPNQCPDTVDLQDYYLSPAASSCGVGQHASPFNSATADAPDCVSYNRLYDRAPAPPACWPAAPVPYRNASASAKELGRVQLNYGPAAAFSRLEALSSMPGTDSLFSLLPSGGPQSIISQNAGAGSVRQQQQSHMVECGSTGRTTSQVLVWQEELANRIKAPVSSFETGRREDRFEAVQSANTASSSMRLSMHASRSAVPPGDSDAEAAGSKGGEVVIRAGRDGNDGFTSDYLKAVQSAAQRTLLPRSQVQSASSAHGGGVRPGGPDCHTLLNSGWAAVAGASNITITPLTSVKVGGSCNEGPHPTYDGYVMLPLSVLPPVPVVPLGTRQSGLLQPLVMHATPSVAAATAAVLRKCLDKGFPFAVIPVKHFSSVIAAAEQNDGPLAYHIVATYGIYYPGVGRHAASSGGGSTTLGSVIAPGCTWGSGSSNGAARAPTASTQSKSPASTAAATAATLVRQLLATGDPLHVMSPSEYHRVQLAAQYSLRQLHDYLVAQPSVSVLASPLAGPQSGPSAASDHDSGSAAMGPGANGGSRMLRQHRRGSSICNESNFIPVVRIQSGLEGPGGLDTGTPVRAGHADSLSPVQDMALLSDPSSRAKALILAAQLGNMARVAHLVRHGADVNAVEGAQHPGTLQGMRGALTGAFNGAGVSAGGRTALHYAAFAGSFGVVQLLLHHGAFVGVRDGTGRTAYDLARRKGHGAVAQLLRDAAERRRDMVRSCAADSRAIAAGAPRPGYPPPVPPRSKQLRSNSAPASGAAMDGSSALTSKRNDVHAVSVANRDQEDASVAAGAKPAVVCAPAKKCLLWTSCSSEHIAYARQPEDAGVDCVDELVELQHSGIAPTAPEPLSGPARHLAPEAGSPAAQSKELGAQNSGALGRLLVDARAPQFNTAVIEVATTSPELEVQGNAGLVRGKGGLLACFMCGA